MQPSCGKKVKFLQQTHGQNRFQVFPKPMCRCQCRCNPFRPSFSLVLAFSYSLPVELLGNNFGSNEQKQRQHQRQRTNQFGHGVDTIVVFVRFVFIHLATRSARTPPAESTRSCKMSLANWLKTFLIYTKARQFLYGRCCDSPRSVVNHIGQCLQLRQISTNQTSQLSIQLSKTVPVGLVRFVAFKRFPIQPAHTAEFTLLPVLVVSHFLFPKCSKCSKCLRCCVQFGAKHLLEPFQLFITFTSLFCRSFIFFLFNLDHPFILVIF